MKIRKWQHHRDRDVENSPTPTLPDDIVDYYSMNNFFYKSNDTNRHHTTDEMSTSINRMYSHDMDDDDDNNFLYIEYSSNKFHPNDCLEPYFEDDDEEAAAIAEISGRRIEKKIQEEERDEEIHDHKNILSDSYLELQKSISRTWSTSSFTNHESKMKSRRKSSYIELNIAILDCISLEYYQNIQNYDEDNLGIFGRARISNDLHNDNTTTTTSHYISTPPSLSLIKEILTLLIKHNAIEYEVIICSLIYYRRLCGLEKPSTLSSTTTASSASASAMLSSSSPSTSTTSTQQINTIPITYRNWKGILIGTLRLATKIWDDCILINKDFIEPLLSHQLIDSSNLLNDYEFYLFKQLNYSLYINDIDYLRCHDMITHNCLSILSHPSHDCNLGNSSDPNSSSTRPKNGIDTSSINELETQNKPSPRQSPLPLRLSRSWSWKLKINRVAASNDDEDTSNDNNNNNNNNTPSKNHQIE